MTINDRISKTLRELRQERNLTQADVASILHMTQQGYAAYESGQTQPSIAIIHDLAAYYNLNISDLIDDNDDTSKAANEALFVDNIKMSTFKAKLTRLSKSDKRELLQFIDFLIFKHSIKHR